MVGDADVELPLECFLCESAARNYEMNMSLHQAVPIEADPLTVVPSDSPAES